MMEVVLTRLRDFSCKTSTFDEKKQEEQNPQVRSHHLRGGCTAGGGGSRLDIESALAWLRMELMEMRSQDQALIRQLMELHSGIQELKQELSEEEQEEDTDEEEEEDSYWDLGSEGGSGSFFSTPGRMVCNMYHQKIPQYLYSRGLPEKVLSRRSSVP
uniref:Family with sequence similarity 167, member Ab n=1 Tax=Nothobranchius kuhntae TaxID=321403 RepID=A0A1A8ICP8_NOTKU